MATVSAEDVSREIVRCEGNLRRVKSRLGCSAYQVYRLLNKYNLWPVVNRARIERMTNKPQADSLVGKARNVLKS